MVIGDCSQTTIVATVCSVLDFEMAASETEPRFETTCGGRVT